MEAYYYQIIQIDGVEYVKEKYPLIIFNDQQLPIGAVFIDFCASANFFDDIDEELSKWFWQFSNCVGLNCSDESVQVLKSATQLKLLIVENEKHVKKIINERYKENDDVSKIFDWWQDTLDIMIETASKKKVSEWTGIPIV